MIIIREPKTSKEWEKYYDIRYRMLWQPWGAPKTNGKKPEDEISKHLAIFSDNEMAGVGMVYNDNGKARIRFIAIDTKYQKKGFGEKLMSKLEEIAKQDGYKKTILWADENAVGFYEKLNYKNLGKGPIIFEKLQQYNMEKDI